MEIREALKPRTRNPFRRVVDVIAVKVTTWGYRLLKIKGAVPVMKAKLDDHGRPQDLCERKKQQGFVPLEGPQDCFLAIKGEVLEPIAPTRA
jgi:hypothetical protein